MPFTICRYRAPHSWVFIKNTPTLSNILSQVLFSCSLISVVVHALTGCCHAIAASHAMWLAKWCDLTMAKIIIWLKVKITSIMINIQAVYQERKSTFAPQLSACCKWIFWFGTLCINLWKIPLCDLKEEVKDACKKRVLLAAIWRRQTVLVFFHSWPTNWLAFVMTQSAWSMNLFFPNWRALCACSELVWHLHSYILRDSI